MKKNLLAFLCSSILAAGLAGHALAEDGGAPTLFVAPFSGSTTAIRPVAGAMDLIMCWTHA